MKAYDDTQISAIDQVQEQLATACKAIGDPLRLSIVRLLGEGSFGVLELSELFDIRQSGMSHHLKVLSQAGLVSRQREGNSIFYRRPLVTGQDVLSTWIQSSFRALDQTRLEQTVQQRLQKVMDDRATLCADFFARNAEAFKEQQDLIASWDQYGEVLETLLATLRTDLPAAPSALEVGPGTGEFLASLSQHFDQVKAVDISAPMLQRALDQAKALQLENVSGVLGDTHVLGSEHSGQYSLMAANMVLHHMPEPKDLFTEAGRLLTHNGCLLLTDLCPHEQNWARESCGDLWLGFAPEDLSAWAEESGLKEGQSQFLGLRNGFQVQFRLFYRV